MSLCNAVTIGLYFQLKIEASVQIQVQLINTVQKKKWICNLRLNILKKNPQYLNALF